MNYKLIDEDWILKQGGFASHDLIYLRNTEEQKSKLKGYIRAFDEIRKQLQSPVEVIKDAFEAGRMFERELIIDVDKYLKNNNYE